MNLALTALYSGLLLVGLCIPGFLLQKSGKLPPNTNKALSMILSYVAQPAISIYSFQINEYRPELLVNMGYVAVFSLVGMLLSLLIGRVIFRRGFKKGSAEEVERNELRTLTITSAFANCGFMGIPFLQELLPGQPEALLYTAVYMLFFNALTWTVGIYIITGDKKYINIKQILLNPPTVALVVALPLFFTNTTLPGPLFSFLTHCQNLAAPVSMILMGIYLAKMSVKELFGDWRVYFTSFLKLVVAPILIFLVSYPFIGEVGSIVVLTCFVIAGMPSATCNMYMNDMFGSIEGSKIAVKGVLLSTLLSIVVVPLMIMLLSLFIPLSI